MIIVYGVYKKLKFDKDLGEMTCTNCGYRVNAALAHEVYTPHFLYIPVFRYTGWRMKFCPSCGVMEKLSKEEFEQIKREG